MNGSGMMIWENVFGTWNGWSARDRSILRAMLPIQRRFVDLFSGEHWTPLVPTLMPDVYASLWEGRGIRLWTLVNRSSEPRAGVFLPLGSRSGERVFDLLEGHEVVISFLSRPPYGAYGRISPRGIACVIAASEKALGHDFERFVRGQRELNLTANWDTTAPARHAALQKAPAPRPAPNGALGPDMVAIPGATIRQRTEFRIRECGFYESAHPHFAQKFPSLHEPFVLEREVALKPYAMDLTPVTNAQFAKFIKGSGYRPWHTTNFLKDWTGGGPPSGKEDHPVVYVDLEDARAYARWAGKRLPSEEEWQYAAQGPEGRKYPWGERMLPERCNSGQSGGTTPVRAFPEGRSTFGVYDLCGNVWEWTESERSDGRTRFCILKGGCFYRARGSVWYADGGPQPSDFAAKFLLMWAGLDRCGTIGFRCAKDSARA
jgi:formylglycine-generating enzyme required for sulfatase activity